MEGFDEIEQQVRKIIAEELQVDEKDISKDSTIAELGGDSLKALMLVSSFETHFDITITDQDALKITSVKSAADTVKKLLAK